MEGKLIKDKEHYYLTVNGNLFAEIGGHPLKSLQGLSLKNCEAIENGYDLDELAENHALEVYDKVEAYEDYQDYVNFNNRRNNFKEGFQKALSILGDKKFSEEDLVSFGKRCFYKGFEKSENDDANCYTAFREEIGELIQSLQQTEFDVEIETIEYGLGNDENGRPVFETRNILDADGCLILKRK